MRRTRTRSGDAAGFLVARRCAIGLRRRPARCERPVAVARVRSPRRAQRSRGTLHAFHRFPPRRRPIDRHPSFERCVKISAAPPPFDRHPSGGRFVGSAAAPASALADIACESPLTRRRRPHSRRCAPRRRPRRGRFSNRDRDGERPRPTSETSRAAIPATRRRCRRTVASRSVRARRGRFSAGPKFAQFRANRLVRGKIPAARKKKFRPPEAGARRLRRIRARCCAAAAPTVRLRAWRGKEHLKHSVFFAHGRCAALRGAASGEPRAAHRRRGAAFGPGPGARKKCRGGVDS